MIKKIILSLLFFTPLSIFSQNLPFNDTIFKAFVDMRVGTGKPVFWYCYGEVYSYPDGKLVAKMEGTDVAHRITITKDSVIQLSRKIFAYFDPKTGAVIDSANGKKLDPIAYPYQYITYIHRNDGKMYTTVEQGAGARKSVIGPGSGIIPRKIGKDLAFAAPLFLNFETPRGKYEAYENYDFFIRSDAKDPKSKYLLSWNRFGDSAPALGGGKGIIQLVSYRVDKFEDLPMSWQTYLKTRAPMWMNPPKDMAEIKDLQK
jgi:hypothetical protein